MTGRVTRRQRFLKTQHGKSGDKFKVPRNPIRDEVNHKKMQPTPERKEALMQSYFDSKINNSQSEAERSGWIKARLQRELDGAEDAIDDTFTRGFQGFCVGRMKADVKTPLWGDRTLNLLDFEGVREYIQPLKDEREQFETDLLLMHEHGPGAVGKINIHSLYLYYKYVLDGASLTDSNFLKDWKRWKGALGQLPQVLSPNSEPRRRRIREAVKQNQEMRQTVSVHKHPRHHGHLNTPNSRIARFESAAQRYQVAPDGSAVQGDIFEAQEDELADKVPDEGLIDQVEFDVDDQVAPVDQDDGGFEDEEGEEDQRAALAAEELQEERQQFAKERARFEKEQRRQEKEQKQRAEAQQQQMQNQMRLAQEQLDVQRAQMQQQQVAQQQQFELMQQQIQAQKAQQAQQVPIGAGGLGAPPPPPPPSAGAAATVGTTVPVEADFPGSFPDVQTGQVVPSAVPGPFAAAAAPIRAAPTLGKRDPEGDVEDAAGGAKRQRVITQQDLEDEETAQERKLLRRQEKIDRKKRAQLRGKGEARSARITATDEFSTKEDVARIQKQIDEDEDADQQFFDALSEEAGDVKPADPAVRVQMEAAQQAWNAHVAQKRDVREASLVKLSGEAKQSQIAVLAEQDRLEHNAFLTAMDEAAKARKLRQGALNVQDPGLTLADKQRVIDQQFSARLKQQRADLAALTNEMDAQLQSRLGLPVAVPQPPRRAIRVERTPEAKQAMRFARQQRLLDNTGEPPKELTRGIVAPLRLTSGWSPGLQWTEATSREIEAMNDEAIIAMDAQIRSQGFQPLSPEAIELVKTGLNEVSLSELDSSVKEAWTQTFGARNPTVPPTDIQKNLNPGLSDTQIRKNNMADIGSANAFSTEVTKIVLTKDKRVRRVERIALRMMEKLRVGGFLQSAAVTA